jgi:peroxiredoxin
MRHLLTLTLIVFASFTNAQSNELAMNSASESPIQSAVPSHFTPGQTMSNFEFMDLDGNTHTRESLKGKIVVMCFWTAGNASFIRNIPIFNNLFIKYKGTNVVFLAPSNASLNTTIRTQKVKNFLWPVSNSNHDYFSKMNISNPINVIINEHGIISDTIEGGIEEQITKIERSLKNIVF